MLLLLYSACTIKKPQNWGFEVFELWITPTKCVACRLLVFYGSLVCTLFSRVYVLFHTKNRGSAYIEYLIWLLFKISPKIANNCASDHVNIGGIYAVAMALNKLSPHYLQENCACMGWEGGGGLVLWFKGNFGHAWVCRKSIKTTNIIPRLRCLYGLVPLYCHLASTLFDCVVPTKQ